MDDSRWEAVRRIISDEVTAAARFSGDDRADIEQECYVELCERLRDGKTTMSHLVHAARWVVKNFRRSAARQSLRLKANEERLRNAAAPLSETGRAAAGSTLDLLIVEETARNLSAKRDSRVRKMMQRSIGTSARAAVDRVMAKFITDFRGDLCSN